MTMPVRLPSMNMSASAAQNCSWPGNCRLDRARSRPCQFLSAQLRGDEAIAMEICSATVHRRPFRQAQVEQLQEVIHHLPMLTAKIVISELDCTMEV